MPDLATNGQTIELARLIISILALAAIITAVARRLSLPESVALVITGLVAGALVPQLPLGITPNLVLVVLVPGLVFEAAYRLRWSELRHALGLITVLAIPGVLISAVVVGLVLWLATGLPFGLAFIVGAMLAATDPVAVVSTFRRLRAPERLATIVEGESLFNDGTGLILFVLAVRSVESGVAPAEAVVAFLSTVAVSVVVGIVFGIVAGSLVVAAGDRSIEITISVVAAYGAYLVADAFSLSGIVATVVAGVAMRRRIDRANVEEDIVETLDVVWGYVAFVLTAIAFLVIGLKITTVDLFKELGPILWGAFAVIGARAFIVYVLLGGVSRLREGADRGAWLPASWRHVVFWSGLRGAIAVAAALSLPLDFPQRSVLQSITFGIVLLTLIVQGATAAPLVRAALGRTIEGRSDEPQPARG